MNLRLAAVLTVVVLVAVVLLWPVQRGTVNEPVEESEATGANPATIAWAKVDFYFKGRGPSGHDEADEDDFWFDSIKVSKGKYVGQGGETQSIGSLLVQSLRWGSHQWEAKIRVQGPETDLKWTTERWTKDLPEGKITTINECTDVFYLSHPGTYTVTVQLLPQGSYAGDSAGHVFAEGSSTFIIPASWQ